MRPAHPAAIVPRGMITAGAPGPTPQATTKPGPLRTEIRSMRRRSIAEVLTGAVVLVVAASFLAYAVAHSGRSTASGYTLYAKFDHIDGLATGADVRIAGVKIGSVNAEQIDPQSFQAVVSLTVRNDIKLPKDTAAIVTSESLLGGKFLSLQPGGSETLLQPVQT